MEEGKDLTGGSRVAQEAQALALPVVESLGLELVDVEYKKEGATWFLRFFIDKPGGVGIDDCQSVSRAIDPLLDQKMDIPGHYSLEVSSPGLERPFKSERDYLRNLGFEVEVSLFQAKDGKKKFEGLLKDFQDGSAVVEVKGIGELAFKKEEISRIHKAVRFG
jgi:ribosome maturation factor RimP